jgi:hypothetical protein
VPPNFQRFLPFILIAFVLLFVLPAVLKKHTTGPSAKTRSTDTIGAMALIDKGEQSFKAAKGRYTENLADLVPGHPLLASDIGIGLNVELSASTDGQSYAARVSSDVISLLRARTGARVTAKNCVVLKTGSGIACPA